MSLHLSSQNLSKADLPFNEAIERSVSLPEGMEAFDAHEFLGIADPLLNQPELLQSYFSRHWYAKKDEWNIPFFTFEPPDFRIQVKETMAWAEHYFPNNKMVDLGVLNVVMGNILDQLRDEHNVCQSRAERYEQIELDPWDMYLWLKSNVLNIDEEQKEEALSILIRYGFIPEDHSNYHVLPLYDKKVPRSSVRLLCDFSSKIKFENFLIRYFFEDGAKETLTHEASTKDVQGMIEMTRYIPDLQRGNLRHSLIVLTSILKFSQRKSSLLFAEMSKYKRGNDGELTDSENRMTTIIAKAGGFNLRDGYINNGTVLLTKYPK